jgi:hypothetical protein
VWATGLLGLTLCGTTGAQSLNEGMEALNKKEREHHTLIKALFVGQAALDPKIPQHIEAVETAAKMITYRYALEVIDKEPGKIDKVYRDFGTDLSYIQRYKPTTQELGKMYSNRVMTYALEVINLPSAKPIARVNAARTMARLPELGQAELADALVEALKLPLKQEQGRDGVRYWILRGMRDLLALPASGPNPVLSKEQEDKIALALLEFLDQKAPVSASAPAEELEGFRMLRREAVRALAQFRRPLINPKARPALVLARFAANDASIQPPPRFDERLEAALGLAALRPDKKEAANYQADCAMQQIGLFIAEFGHASDQNLEVKFVFERTRPWKIDAARLTEALTAMKAEVKDPYVAKSTDVALRVVNLVGQRKLAGAGDLSWFTSPENAAPNQELFKGMADSTIKPAPAEPARTTAAEK